MRNFKLTLAYDGTAFHGWQIQPGRPTIQGALADVACKITQERIAVHAAGRTDAGVHALGQVANFKTRSALSAQEFQRAFNALLPPAIRIVAAEEVGPDFHARWQALEKTYRYRIFRGRIVPPFQTRYVLHYPYPLEEEAMAQAAGQFQGQHDFMAFAASSGCEQDDRERTTVREVVGSQVYRVPVSECGGWTPLSEVSGGQVFSPDDTSSSFAHELVYEIRGRSFLRYMVRKIVGTLIDVGKGKFTAADIPRLFEQRDRSAVGPTVPPHGLCLVSVVYPEPWKLG